MENLDIPVLKFAFDVVQTAVMVGISIYVWIVTNHKVNADKIAELEEKHNGEIEQQRNRLTAIETKLDHMPNREQISRIHQRIDELNQSVHEVQGVMKGLADNNAMILETLIKQGTKK